MEEKLSRKKCIPKHNFVCYFNFNINAVLKCQIMLYAKKLVSLEQRFALFIAIEWNFYFYTWLLNAATLLNFI
jgi:hypothetical protein